MCVYMLIYVFPNRITTVCIGKGVFGRSSRACVYIIHFIFDSSGCVYTLFAYVIRSPCKCNIYYYIYIHTRACTCVCVCTVCILYILYEGKRR